MKPSSIRLLAALLLAVVIGRSAEVTLDLTFAWREQPITVPSAPLSNATGQSLTITRVAGLISEIAFVRADGTSLALPGQFGHFDAASGRHALTLHGVPVGDYTGLNFRVGVPPSVNHLDPGLWSAQHPLNPLVNQLHWGWQGGYVFIAIEGHYRSTSDTTTSDGFSYHLATDALEMPVRFTRPFAITGDSRVTLMLDLADILGDLAINSVNASTHSRDADPLAAQLAKKVPTAFWFGAATPETKSAPAVVTTKTSATAALPFPVPAGWPQPDLPADNAPTALGVALGESLFYDSRLSAGSAQSCATCHAPARAFSDTVAFSLGADGQPGARNAMPLVNLAWSSTYTWDGGKPRIRDQAIAALLNPIEMHGDPSVILPALARDPALRTAFAAAFGDDLIDLDRIGRALEQFLLTQVSADSRFDRALRGETKLTDLEKRGLELFNMEYDPRRQQFGADCFHCHGGALFSDYAMKNNGLDLVSADRGRATVTQLETDAGKFKTPSLRRVSQTAPYMHDGRFATLEEVVTHYVSGLKRPANLDPNLAKHPGGVVPLSDQDQAALVAFLRTL